MRRGWGRAWACHFAKLAAAAEDRSAAKAEEDRAYGLLRDADGRTLAEALRLMQALGVWLERVICRASSRQGPKGTEVHFLQARGPAFFGIWLSHLWHPGQFLGRLFGCSRRGCGRRHHKVLRVMVEAAHPRPTSALRPTHHWIPLQHMCLMQRFPPRIAHLGRRPFVSLLLGLHSPSFIYQVLGISAHLR